jgi:cyclopropane fatty-acyl-phospholipid synthase-like methyltransferase
VNDALARFVEDDPDPDETEHARAEEETEVEAKISLSDQRLGTVLATLKQSAAKRVIDLGCGEGRMLQLLLKEKQFEEIVGMMFRTVAWKPRRIDSTRIASPQCSGIGSSSWHGSLIYRDKRLAGYDAASVVEVIEHLDPPRLAAFERVLFEFARPKSVVVTQRRVQREVADTSSRAVSPQRSQVRVDSCAVSGLGEEIKRHTASRWRTHP